MTAVTAKPLHSSHTIFFILFTVFLDTVGFGLIIPVLPELLMQLSDLPTSSAVAIGGWLMFVYASVQFFAAPILGNLSDQYGRRPVLLVSLLAFAADYIVLGFANSLWLLFAARMVAGACGATHAMAAAYIADVAPAEKRPQYFGWMGAAFGGGFIVGPALGGLLGEFSPRLPFFAAAAAALLNAAYGYFVLPETLSKENRRPFSFKRANPIGSLNQIRLLPVVSGLFLALFLMLIAHDSLPAVWTWYTIEKFSWTQRDIGLSLALVGVCNFVVMGFFIGPVTSRIGTRNAGILGLTVGATGFFGFALASEGWHLLVWIVPFALMGFSNPAINSILVSQVPSNAQGELQGARASLAAVATIIAPVLMTQLMHVFSREGAPIYLPGVSYLLAGFLMLAACVVFIRSQRQL